jgi:predicted ArsR family transcriptional regulator
MTDTPLPAIDLERDGFLRDLLRELSGALQEVVGLEEASGFISVVGRAMGDKLRARYEVALGTERLPPERLSAVLVDLKKRIQGDFYVLEEDESHIVFGNRRCPFGDRVRDRPSLCMMTSNVFGSIAAHSTGYSKVVLEQTIALGHPGCRVVVHLRPTPAAEAAEGREYFGEER